jgi:hypothetical protein
MENNSSLLDLFIPPQGYFGDFGMLCGFTASREVLQQLKNRFSGDTSRPVLAAFIHPTPNAISDIPGLAWAWMEPNLSKRGYALLHAKVALLGFRQRDIGADVAGYVIRLAVSTGNWTQDPLTNSIDLYWAIDLDTSSIENNTQNCIDVLEAWKLFEWLRDPIRSNTGLLLQEYDGRLTDQYLSWWIEQIQRQTGDLKDKPKPRFIDNHAGTGLMTQVVGRMKDYRGKRNRLIIGSGFFESEKNNKTKPTVPERIKEELESKLSNNIVSEIILNQGACQRLADDDVKARLKNKWILKKPNSMQHTDVAKLHAKFVLLASDSDTDECKGQLYLGSGNMTEPGFVNSAGSHGNLEAGVVFNLPKGLSWSNKKGLKKIATLLPIGGAIIEPENISAGADFEVPIEPDAIPPVSYLLWNNEKIEAAQETPISLKIIGNNGEAKELPCDWPGTPPLMVQLVEGGWWIPVVANGALVAPKLRDLTIEDVLAGLTGFPVSAEVDPENDADVENGPHVFNDIDQNSTVSHYAIRRMMELLVPLTQAQAKVAPNDWHRWCRELQQNLTLIANYEERTIKFFRDAGANPLRVLLDSRMRHPNINVEDVRKLDEALENISKCWGIEKHPCLWSNIKETL